MIVDLKTIKEEIELTDISDDKLKRKIKAIEKSIRKHTNNKFLDLHFRYCGEIKDGEIILNTSHLLSENDNIQLSHCLNNGVYTIEVVDDNRIKVMDDILFDCNHVMVTKVVYPEDIQEGVINMLKWDFGLRNKIGIKSETISRHSVTYFDMDKNNTLKGYPVSLLGFLEDYMKARS